MDSVCGWGVVGKRLYRIFFVGRKWDLYQVCDLLVRGVVGVDCGIWGERCEK